jgi:hypothetical protein
VKTLGSIIASSTARAGAGANLNAADCRSAYRSPVAAALPP